MHKVTVALPLFLLGLTLAALLSIATGLLLDGDISSLWRWMLAAGFVLFVYYGMDKAQARRNAQRIPKWTLHLLALAGGVFGGWLGMFYFRNKNKQWDFQAILLAATILWVWLLWYFW